MSNFACEKCGKICYDSPNGYITGCEHYPAEVPELDQRTFFLPLLDDMAHIDPKIFKQVVESFKESPNE